jgi:hypothetical protein
MPVLTLRLRPADSFSANSIPRDFPHLQRKPSALGAELHHVEEFRPATT